MTTIMQLTGQADDYMQDQADEDYLVQEGVLMIQMSGHYTRAELLHKTVVLSDAQKSYDKHCLPDTLKCAEELVKAIRREVERTGDTSTIDGVIALMTDLEIQLSKV